MAFRVGQKVVCIAQASNPYGEAVPQVGSVYTIREVCDGQELGPCYRLIEIVNPPMDYSDGHRECDFTHRLFRPVIERKPDISCFVRILDKVNSKQPAKV
jgi:hypothetical protein